MPGLGAGAGECLGPGGPVFVGQGGTCRWASSVAQMGVDGKGTQCSGSEPGSGGPLPRAVAAVSPQSCPGLGAVRPDRSTGAPGGRCVAMGPVEALLPLSFGDSLTRQGPRLLTLGGWGGEGQPVLWGACGCWGYPLQPGGVVGSSAGAAGSEQIGRASPSGHVARAGGAHGVCAAPCVAALTGPERPPGGWPPASCALTPSPAVL